MLFQMWRNSISTGRTRCFAGYTGHISWCKFSSCHPLTSASVYTNEVTYDIHDMGKYMSLIYTQDSVTVSVNYITIYQTVGLSNSLQVMLAALAVTT